MSLQVGPKLMVEQLLAGSAMLYIHGEEQFQKAFVVALPGAASDDALEQLLKLGRQFQVFVNTDAWPQGEGPTSDVFGNGKSVAVDLSVQGLKALFYDLDRWRLQQRQGWDRMVIRSFPRGDVLVHGGPEAFLLEALSHAQEAVKYVWVAEVSPAILDLHGGMPEAMAKVHGLKTLNTAEVIDSRIDNPSLICHTGVISSPLKAGTFKVHSFYAAIDRRYHWTFAGPSFATGDEAPLVRVESECLTGHVLGSLLCDCGAQLETGLEKVQQDGNGALIYLRQEGRGIGLVNKLKAYRLQQQEAMDTVDANLAIGAPEDARDYLIAALILKSFGISKVRLLTNNPAKVEGLEKYGIQVVERVAHVIPPSKHNERYLSTKKQRMGHLI